MPEAGERVLGEEGENAVQIVGRHPVMGPVLWELISPVLTGRLVNLS